jgi:hypothetical protein
MVYLANVPSAETTWGIECYTQHAHVSIDFPSDEIPSYAVLMHWPQPRGGWPVRTFKRFDDAMDFASSFLKQSEA